MMNLPPGPNPNSKEADFIYNEKQIYKKISQTYLPLYGPIFTLYKDRTPCVIISDIDIAYDVFVNNSNRKSAGRSPSYGERLLSGNCNNILNSDYGPVWKILQRYLYKGLQYCANYDRMDEMMQTAFGMFRKNLQNGRGASKATKGIKVSEDMFWLSDNVMTLLLFNEVFEERDYGALQKALDDVINQIDETDFDKPRKGYEFQAVQTLKLSIDRLLQIIQKRIDEHRERGDYKIACVDLTDFILLGIDECADDPVARKFGFQLTEVHAKHVLIDAIFASQEGLGNTFNWFVGLLALYPHIQERIRVELNYFRDDTETLPSLYWKSKMPYTMAVVCEFQRFASADTLSDFHKALDDIQVTVGAPYIIPRDSLILLNIYAIHNDPVRIHVPDQVIPERFLSEDGTQFRRRKDFVPYGLGSRRCTGGNLSENILFMLLLLMVDSYQLVWSPSNKSFTIQDDKNASFIRDIKDFNIQFLPLK